jgi:bifunctional non-homologous end joining protein LigD
MPPNVGCIEMHPWYSRVHNFAASVKVAKKRALNEEPLDENKCGLERPDFIVFDLDPYVYSGKEQVGQEPEYNARGFRAAVEVAFELKELFGTLKIKCFVDIRQDRNTHFCSHCSCLCLRSNKTICRNCRQDSDRTAPEQDHDGVDTSRRKGKVFFDHNQNAKGKTIASIFSVRPTVSATVSMPIELKKLGEVLPTDFTMLNVPEILKKTGDPWKKINEKNRICVPF